MAGPTIILPKSFPAGEELTKFHGVVLQTDGTVDMADTLGQQIIGVVQEHASEKDAELGRIVNVQMLGITRAIAGAELIVGTRVRVNAAGRFVPATAGSISAGIVTTGAAANGDHFDLFLTPGAVTPA